MSNLYNVYLKLGKSSYSTQFYSNTVENILSFCERNLYSKVTKITEIVYDVSNTVNPPVDDPLQYQGTLNFMVRNEADKKANKIVVKCVKNTRTSDQVYSDIQTLLKLDRISSVSSLISVTQNTK